jgi:DNA-binding CsgD family transcriptional regulator
MTRLPGSTVTAGVPNAIAGSRGVIRVKRAAPLSVADIASVQQAARVMLSCLQQPSLDAWRGEVNHTLKRLLHADAATFMLSVPGFAPYYNADVSESVATGIVSGFSSVSRQLSVWKRACQLGAWNERMLFGRQLPTFLNSDYRRDFLRVNGLGSVIGMSVGDGSGEATALVLLHRACDTRPFSANALAMLRLMLPSFEAGVQLASSTATMRRDMSHVLDSVAAGVLIVDKDGTVLQQSATFSSLIADDPQAGRVYVSAMQLARQAMAGANGAAGDRSSEVRTSRGRYHLRASSYAGYFFHRQVCTMIVLTRSSLELPSVESLRSEYRLSAQEARVCLLLAKGMSNGEIAAALGISTHTARHHTERVMLCLGINSRSQVMGKLLGYAA